MFTKRPSLATVKKALAAIGLTAAAVLESYHRGVLPFSLPHWALVLSTDLMAGAAALAWLGASPLGRLIFKGADADVVTQQVVAAKATGSRVVAVSATGTPKILVPVIALLFLALGFSSCATFEKNLPTIIADVDEGTLVIQTIATFVDGYFANHPDPSAQTTVDTAIVRVETAASALLAIGRAAGDLTSGQGPAAVAEFESAYTDLLALVKTFGVSVGTKGARIGAVPGTLAAPAGGLIVPAAADLMLVRGVG